MLALDGFVGLDIWVVRLHGLRFGCWLCFYCYAGRVCVVRFLVVSSRFVFRFIAVLVVDLRWIVC